MKKANEALQEACEALEKLFVGEASPSVGPSADDAGFYKLFWKTFLPSITAFNLMYGLRRSHEAK